MKSIILAIIVVLVLLGGVFLFAPKNKKVDNIPVNNVTIIDGKQIIELRAKGGYFPEKSIAKAGIPTILRLDASGTFDCSSIVRIQSMNISKILPQTGSTDIDLGNPKLGILQGTCGMGMYPFEIDFQS
ncbi:MAG: hypothetical protein US18_C0014G0002 [Parcubacteria group bacterium GW2011_GWB1_36_5]|nr:MAG: hypothetical protein US12_C0014G0002 [Parcubacteria group bacterium GW2011_GWA2_36_24]KKQ07510.1 MAG: hypothetical protein US18_C0014G0002 [Parcubacteria group bacterium GW2011_GWB1_36_5]